MKNLALFIAFTFAAVAHTQSFSSTDFESPWSAGTNGLQMDSGANTSQGWQTFISGGAANIVQNGQANAGGVNAFSGTQMAQISTDTNVGSSSYAWTPLQSQFAGRTPGNDVIHTSTEFYFSADNERANTYYGVVVYTGDDSTPLGEFLLIPGASSSVGTVNLNNNETQGVSMGFNRSVFTGQWNKLDMYVDFHNDLLSAIVTIGGTGYYLGSVPMDPANAALGLGDSDYFAINVGAVGGTTPSESSVYFDDYSVEAIPSAPAPEPITLFGLGLGVAALIRRRSR